MFLSLRYWLPALPGLLLFSFIARGQTVLRPGDLVVLGVNANLAGCGQVDADLISFVSFRDITTGTLIDITDNGWERVNAGQWGNSEGFITVRRTGPAIPAGTVITFELPPVGQSDAYRAVAPDGEWEFTQLSVNTLNFNSGGDQIYFLQGGEWMDGGTTGNFNHDATYDGGLILFGFNTATEWNGFVDDTQNSGLHPDVEPCYHMEPTGGTTDFISYTGSATPAGQLEWIARVADAANWTSYADCGAYQAPPASISLTTGDISLACTVCTGCDTIQEQFVFTLPDTGGPFNVTYTDGTSEYTAAGLADGGTAMLEVTKTLTFSILSVEDAGGCPVYSNFGDSTVVTVEAAPPIAESARLQACDDGSGSALFDLTSLDETVNLATGEPVSWYEDAARTQPIADPAAYVSGAITVFAVVGAAGCTSPPAPVELTLAEPPAVEAVVDQDPSCSNFTDGGVTLRITGGNPPYRIDWSDDAFDDEASPDNMPAGTYSVTVTDRGGCQDSTSVTLGSPNPLELDCGEQQPASNVGAADGIAGIRVAGGAAPYMLRWSGPASGNLQADEPGDVSVPGLPAGNYSLEVVDANGCSLTCAFTISDPSCRLAVDILKTDVSCAGLSDGALDLTINNGTGPYEINWDVDRFDGQEDLTGLPAGTYTVIVTDAAGCTATAAATVESSFPALSADISPGGPICPGECFGFLLTLRGTAPFTIAYEIDVNGLPQTRTFQTSLANDQFEVCPDDLGVTAGPLEVRFLTLTDANCQANLNRTASILLLDEPVTDLDTLLCFGDSLLINGVTYNAANPTGSELISGGAVSGCDSLVNISLRFTEGSEYRIDSTLCEGESITVNGNLYDEGNPSGTEVIKGGAASGCDSIIVVSLTYQTDTLVDLNPVLCRGQSLTVNGTVYDESNPGGTEVLQRASGCDSTVQVALRFADSLVTTIDTLLCRGEQITVNGTVYDENNPSGREVFPAGPGSSCDSIVVVDLSFSGGETLLNQTLCEGSSITVNGTVYDQNNPSGREVIAGGSIAGCDSTVVISLSFNGPVTVSIDSTLCAQESLTVNGTVYDESNPGGTELLRRVSGCDSTVVINLSFVPGATATLEGGGSICPGDTSVLTFRLSGAATADVRYSDGVNPPVLLNDISDGHTVEVTPPTTTTYSIDFVLVNGAACPPGVDGSVTVEVSDLGVAIEPVSDYNGYGVSCFGSSDGALRAVVTGSGGEPRWSTGATTETIDDLPAGEYSVSLSNGGTCEVTAAYLLIEPDSITVQTSLIEPTCPDDEDGALTLEAVDGGAAPYTWSVNGGDAAPVGALPVFIRDIGSGELILTVTDANGCSAEQRFTVGSVADLTLELGEDRTIGRGDSVVLSPQVNFSVDSFVWSPTGSLRDPNVLNPVARPQVTTTYTLHAFDPKGCDVSDRVTVLVEERSRVYLPTAFSPNEDGVNDFFSLFARSTDVQTYTLRVFDRWGSLVCERENLPANAEGDGWDGTVRGQDAHAGVYVYFVEINYLDGTQEMMSGEITLIR